MRRLLATFALLIASAALLAAVGCGNLTKKLTGSLNANQAPHTVLFVNGAVDTVNHVVHLYWFGTDTDGSVTGYEWRLDNPAAPADTGWRFTTATDSIFTVATPNGYTAPVFSVRAIDDAGLRDPQPPVQDFEFSNQPPTVRLTTKPLPSDTTFASVSVVWSSNDPDGDAAKLRYLVWLDGNEASPEITTSNSLTMPTARFGTPGAALATPRKLFVRAIDDGGMAGPVDSCVWFVRKPVTGTNARLLLIDEVPRTNAANLRFDTLYSNTCARLGLPATDYAVLRLDTTQPFKTAADVAQTFKLFQAVAWYRGNEITFSTLLQTAQPGISDYLRTGGRFYLDGLYLVGGKNASGPLTEVFVREHMNSDGMVGAFTNTPTFADTSIGFGNTGTSVFLPHVVINNVTGRDSLYVRQVFTVRAGEAGGLRQFKYRDRNEVVLWGAPGTLTPSVGDSTAVGVSVVQPSGGRATVICMPPGGAAPAGGAGTAAGSAAKFVTNALRQLLGP